MHLSKHKEVGDIADERRSIKDILDFLKHGEFVTICTQAPQLRTTGVYVVNGPVLKLKVADLAEFLPPLLEAKLAENTTKLADIGVMVAQDA